MSSISARYQSNHSSLARNSMSIRPARSVITTLVRTAWFFPTRSVSVTKSYGSGSHGERNASVPSAKTASG